MNNFSSGSGEAPIGGRTARSEGGHPARRAGSGGPGLVAFGMEKRQNGREASVRGPGVRRTAFGRMKRIYGWLREGRYPNCTSIAEDLEVSSKSAARDIEHMRDQWGLAIEYDDKRHGFFLTTKPEREPWVPVSEADLFTVCITQKVLETYKGLPICAPLELAFRKITAALDEEERYTLANLEAAFSVRPFAPEDADVQVLQTVTRAVAEGRVLRFRYRKPGQKAAETREVRPYHVVEHQGRMYLLAHDARRTAVRTFALRRMQGAA